MKNHGNKAAKLLIYLTGIVSVLSLSGCIRFYGGDRELDFCTNDPNKVTKGVRYCPSESKDVQKDKK